MTSTLPSSSLSRSSCARRNFFSAQVRTRPASPALTVHTPQLFSRDVGSRFGCRLREIRRARRLTQTQMAVDFGIDRSYISEVENGKKSISLRLLEVIALGMDVSLSELLTDL